MNGKEIILSALSPKEVYEDQLIMRERKCAHKREKEKNVQQKERCKKINEGCEQRVKKGELRVDAQKKRETHAKGKIEEKRKELDSDGG